MRCSSDISIQVFLQAAAISVGAKLYAAMGYFWVATTYKEIKLDPFEVH
jgi:hypothetical protein